MGSIFNNSIECHNSIIPTSLFITLLLVVPCSTDGQIYAAHTRSLCRKKCKSSPHCADDPQLQFLMFCPQKVELTIVTLLYAEPIHISHLDLSPCHTLAMHFLPIKVRKWEESVTLVAFGYDSWWAVTYIVSTEERLPPSTQPPFLATFHLQEGCQTNEWIVFMHEHPCLEKCIAK